MSRTALLLAAALLAIPAPAFAQDTERIYQEACDAGDLVACNVFGLMYEVGDGVPQDLARAGLLYARACEGGQLVGCTNLGLLHEAGAGVARDSMRALGLYRVACEGGDVLGCDRLSSLEAASASDVTGPLFFKRGRVGDAGSGEPLDETLVHVPDLGIRVVSDASGRFELANLPAGQHRITAERLGYEPLDGQINVPGSEDLLLLLSQSVPVASPAAPGHIEGRVSGAGDERLQSVEVSVVGQGQARALTNQQGRFTLRDVAPGLVEVRFALLGYAPRTATLVVQPGRTSEISATMSIRPIELEAMQVTVRSTFLERNGFYRRGGGERANQFNRSEIEVLDPFATSDLLRRVPGVRLQYGQGGEARAVSRRTTSLSQGECVLAVYVDGIPTFSDDFDWIAPQELEAVEVYSGLNVPIEYTSGANSCGVILLWTRR